MENNNKKKKKSKSKDYGDQIIKGIITIFLGILGFVLFFSCYGIKLLWH